MSFLFRMLITLSFLATISAHPLSQYPLYIGPLKHMVMGPDKRILDTLDDDDFTERSVLKEKFDVILERQSEKIKKRYSDEVELLETRRHQWEELRRASLHVEDRALYDDIRSIRADLTLSFSKAEEKEHNLLMMIEHKERQRKMMYDSDSGSHSGEDFDD